MMYKTMGGQCYVGDKGAVGDNAAIKVAITVGVEKHNGVNKTKRVENI